jgi:hypothetical protein
MFSLEYNLELVDILTYTCKEDILKALKIEDYKDDEDN